MRKCLDKSWRNCSVSSGAMRREDLIPSFTSFLQRAMQSDIDLSKEAVSVIENAEEFMNKHINAFKSWYPLLHEAREEADYILDDLLTAMNNIAPIGYYFGVHPGDGSDYGFWEAGNDDDW